MQVFIRNKLMERHLKLEKELSDTERDYAAHVKKGSKYERKVNQYILQDTDFPNSTLKSTKNLVEPINV
jgi:hypothetical protein